jgi:hypothetical protein
MAANLTESFCERCGTRYTFETPNGRSGRLSGVRVLGKGIRKLALTRASSLDEAIESARHDDEREASERQLEAFHGAFHFCLSCRQYTCTECWNGEAGVCLGCAPTPESEAAERSAAEREAAEREAVERIAAARAAAQQAAAEREAAERAAAEREAADQARKERAAAARVAAVKAAAVRSAARRSVKARTVAAAAVEDAASLGEPVVARALAPAPAPDVPAGPVEPAEPALAQLAVDPRAVVTPDGPESAIAPPDETERSSIQSDSGTAAAHLTLLAPGTSLDDAIAAYEASLEVSAVAASGTSEPETLAEAQLLPAAEPELPAPVVAELEAPEAPVVETEAPVIEAVPPAGRSSLSRLSPDRFIRKAVEAALARPMGRAEVPAPAERDGRSPEEPAAVLEPLVEPPVKAEEPTWVEPVDTVLEGETPVVGVVEVPVELVDAVVEPAVEPVEHALVEPEPAVPAIVEPAAAVETVEPPVKAEEPTSVEPVDTVLEAETPVVGVVEVPVELVDAVVEPALEPVEHALVEPEPAAPVVIEAAAEPEPAAPVVIEAELAPAATGWDVPASPSPAAREAIAWPAVDVAPAAPPRVSEPDLLEPAALAPSPAAEDPRIAAWRIVAPDPVAPLPGSRPGGVPARPVAGAGVGAGAAGSQAAGRAAGSATAAPAHACIQCGLSLSATARFCRRCGTRQI